MLSGNRPRPSCRRHFRAIGVLLALVLLIGACNDSEKEPALTADQRGVARAVEEYDAAYRTGDFDAVCLRLVPRTLAEPDAVAARARERKACEQRLSSGEGGDDAAAGSLSVEGVDVSGDRATARLRRDAGDTSRTDEVELRRLDGRWMIVLRAD